MARKSFSIHSDYYSELNNLEPEQRSEILLALIEWANDEDVRKLDPVCALLFRVMTSQMERISSVNSVNGKKGGLAKQAKPSETSEAKRNKPTVTVTVTDTVPNTSLTKVSDERARVPRRSIPPTVEEVNEYCIERNNKISPQYFVDYYTTRGWKLTTGKTMVDWQAAIRTWERSNFDTGKLTDKEKRERERNERSKQTGRIDTDERRIGHDENVYGISGEVARERNAGTNEDSAHREIDGDVQSGEQKAVSLKDFLERNPKYNQVWGVP